MQSIKDRKIESKIASPAASPGKDASSPVVSIIIVNYNARDFLLQCLRSIDIAMSNVVGEVIVVDNHSTDGSVSYLEHRFPHVQFISLDENKGFARANNIALERARGEFILFLNPDTLLEENTLNVMISYMQNHPEVGISGCRVLNPDGTLQLACRRSYPTLWASFCKISGLQKLFPRSRVFAQYNQTFRDEHETCFVDAVSGSFMFGRGSALSQSGGFDPDFFMYGEDLDLCYRVSQAGWKISYVPETSVIHYKGVSTERSLINRIEIFYGAMVLFTKKHHSRSAMLLRCLHFGIRLHSWLARAWHHRLSLFVLILDLLSMNGALLVATKLRFGRYFGFPPEAYPTVFFALSLVILGSMIAAGEYFESRPSLRRALTGQLIGFFLLTALTNFFKNYAFSRGVLLLVFTFGVVSTGLLRALVAVYERSLGKGADRRISIVGTTKAAAQIVRALQSAEARSAILVGIITRESERDLEEFQGIPILGRLSQLPELIARHRLEEIILTDSAMQRKEVMELIAKASTSSVRFHVAFEYEDIIVSHIVNEVAGIEPTLPPCNIRDLRYRAAKRMFDIAVSVLLLTVGLPALYLLSHHFYSALKKLWQVLKGGYSIVGLYPLGDQQPAMGKIGVLGLAHISKPQRLSPQVIQELNEYYIQNCTLTLDLDILLKSVIRKLNGS